MQAEPSLLEGGWPRVNRWIELFFTTLKTEESEQKHVAAGNLCYSAAGHVEASESKSLIFSARVRLLNGGWPSGSSSTLEASRLKQQFENRVATLYLTNASMATAWLDRSVSKVVPKSG